MELRDLENREDVFLLVSTFYSKIKKDDFIGPIFLKIIPAHDWQAHIEKLTENTDFYFPYEVLLSPSIFILVDHCHF